MAEACFVYNIIQYYNIYFSSFDRSTWQNAAERIKWFQNVYKNSNNIYNYYVSRKMRRIVNIRNRYFLTYTTFTSLHSIAMCSWEHMAIECTRVNLVYVRKYLFHISTILLIFREKHELLYIVWIFVYVLKSFYSFCSVLPCAPG